MDSPPWYLAFDAGDWIGTAEFQAIPGAEANGEAVEAEIQALVAGQAWGDDFEYDPEADTIAIFSLRRDGLERLISEIQRAGLIEDFDLEIYATEDDATPAESSAPDRSDAAPAAPTKPGPLSGPHRWPDTGALRAFLHNDTRWEWRELSGDELAAVVKDLLAKAGLLDALEISVDGRESIAIDGASVGDFRRAAAVLGLDGIDDDD